MALIFKRTGSFECSLNKKGIELEITNRKTTGKNSKDLEIKYQSYKLIYGLKRTSQRKLHNTELNQNENGTY